MLVKDITIFEKKYYLDKNEGIIPELLCDYFENNNFELTCYLSDKYKNNSKLAEFYYMMSLVELKYPERAIVIYQKNKGDWFDILRECNIYWKHIALFVLYFLEFDIPEYFLNIFDEHYDNDLVKLIEFIRNEKENIKDIEDILKLSFYQSVSSNYPVLKYIQHFDKNEEKNLIVSFENIQWKIWNKYNNNIKNGNNLGIETVYKQDEIVIYSYQPKEVSASMHIITDGKTTIILDAGSIVTEFSDLKIPINDIFAYLDIGHVDGVIITHAHRDHYGSLNNLKQYEIFMTKPTKELIRISSPDIKCSQANIIEKYESINLNGVIITFVPNGHIYGSVAVNINWKDKKRIVYTGDYTLYDQKTVKGLNLSDLINVQNKRVDVLLIESTFGKTSNMLKVYDYEKLFVDLCEKYYIYGNKIIITCSSIGTAQEVLIFLSDIVEKYKLKINVDGLAVKVSNYYKFSLKLNNIGNTYYDDTEYEEKIINNDIIIVSSGRMRQGSKSLKYLERVLDKDNICIINLSPVSENEHFLKCIENRKNSNINFVDIPLSAHADYDSLIKTLETISPDCAIYVHGSGVNYS